MSIKSKPKSIYLFLYNLLWIAAGTFLAALAIRVFLYPNMLIDGGVIGLSLITARLLGSKYLSYFLILFNLPFLYLSYKYIRKSFVIQMALAIGLFAGFLSLLETCPPFHGDPLEIIVLGGAILGTGVGCFIKGGGCTDGTEILAIIMNRKLGFTVGQIVLFINIFVFTAYGFIFQDWHIAIRSLLTYIVAFKMIDLVIAGFEEVKSVFIITSKPKQIKKLVMHELGLGLTIIPAFGGFSGEQKEILFLIVERLEVSSLKEIVLSEDPNAFMAIQNLNEIAYGRSTSKISKNKKKPKRFFIRF